MDDAQLCLDGSRITLRMYLPILAMAGIPFAAAYLFVAWICWIPNLLFAEWLQRRGRNPPVGFSPKQISP